MSEYLKSAFNIKYIWSSAYSRDLSVEVEGPEVSWYIPFVYYNSKVLIDEYTFRFIRKKKY